MRKKVEKVKKGGGVFSFIVSLFSKEDKPEDTSKNSNFSSQQMGDIEKKAEDEGFRVVIRSMATSPFPDRPAKMLDDITRSFNQYNYIGLNSFAFLKDNRIEKFSKRFISRLFTRPYFTRKQ